MLSILSSSNYAPFNIASEEYILKNFVQDVFLLYINNPSIIVGRHQNTLAEVNHAWVLEHQISVVRRLTGGGSVFHDPGNLNFSFIMKGTEDGGRSFERYTLPVLEVLHDLGVNAVLEGRNDLTIEGRKFSGNAKTTACGKTLHHGTILFSSRISDLSAALKVSETKFKDKAVKSVSARVTNVSEHLDKPLSLHQFVNLIQAKVHSLYPDIEPYRFNRSEQVAINKLVEEKYNTWDWNYGRSPRYNLHHDLRCKAGTIEFYLQVEKGIIAEVSIYGDFFSNREIGELEQGLIGINHQREAMAEALQKLDYKSFFSDVELEEILGVLF